MCKVGPSGGPPFSCSTDIVPHALSRHDHDALGVMEGHLKDRAFIMEDHYSSAEIALGPFLAVRAWLERVRTQPDHVPITQD